METTLKSQTSRQQFPADSHREKAEMTVGILLLQLNGIRQDLKCILIQRSYGKVREKMESEYRFWIYRYSIIIWLRPKRTDFEVNNKRLSWDDGEDAETNDCKFIWSALQIIKNPFIFIWAFSPDKQIFHWWESIVINVLCCIGYSTCHWWKPEFNAMNASMFYHPYLPSITTLMKEREDWNNINTWLIKSTMILEDILKFRLKPKNRFSYLHKEVFPCFSIVK